MKKLFVVLIACLCNNITASAAPTLNDPNLTVTEIVAGLSSPTTMAFIGPDDILVLQKNDGKVRRVINGVLQPSAVLDVNVDNASERGLLGIALHPNFPVTPFVYLYYTESALAGDSGGSPAANRVYRYTWNGSSLGSPALILDLPATPGPNHDGGVITFGPDGKLYVVIGDLNHNGQLQNNGSGAPPDDTGVIFRLNDDGSTPADNPFSGQGTTLARYFAYGIRNSFGMAFDPATNKLWITHNGPNTFDEIDMVEPGFNSGWNKIMGPDARNSANAISDLLQLPNSRYSDPKFSWLSPVGPTGIVFFNSPLLGAQYENDVFVGDVNNGNLYRFQPNSGRDGFVLTGAGLADLVADNGTELNEVVFGAGFNGITDLKVGPDGRLYVVSLGDGKIYAISSNGGTDNGPLSVGAASLSVGEVGVPYDADLNISGGTSPRTVDIIRGALPLGLNISAEHIVGTPAVARNSLITFRVTDQLGATAIKRLKVSVVKPVSIATKKLAVGRSGRPYGARLGAVGGQQPYTWSIVGETIPGDLTIEPETGRLTATSLPAGSTELTFQVTDSLNGAAQKTLTLTVR
jgi:aldose sugar dehydrogenase